jgi:hypothetical protein
MFLLKRKKIMQKLILGRITILIILLSGIQAKGQLLKGQKSIELSFGQTDLGYIIHGGYSAFLSDRFSLSCLGFFETASPYQLTYKNFGLSVLGRYRLISLEDILLITPYAGLEGNLDQITPVGKAYNNSFNYGLHLGLEAEVALNQRFSFIGTFNQLLLVKPLIGGQRYDYNLGVRLYLN